MAWWAEHGVWLVDEFRDGNVPAEFEAQAFLNKAFGALPGSVRNLYLRADSAFYNEAALTWADERGISFCVSADMSKSLLKKVRALPDSAWKPYTTLRRDGSAEPSPAEEREWAEVPDFVPDWNRNNKKSGTAFRYIAVRVRSRQRL